MAMKVRYTCVNGEIIAENRGGTRKLYVNNPLGSVVALLSSTQTQTDTFTYWPYGESAGPGTGPHTTPFQFVGSLGYYTDSTMRVYVRARTLRQDLGRWMTLDTSPATFEYAPISPNQYRYVRNLPPSIGDPSGAIDVCCLLGLWCCKNKNAPNLAKCLKECADKSGKQRMYCLGLCMGKQYINNNCQSLVCRVMPQFCPSGDPCKGSGTVDCQNCCQTKFYCCIATTKPEGWTRCYTQDQKCEDNCTMCVD